MAHFRATVDYQTEGGDASSASLDVAADSEESANAIAQSRVAHDRRRRVGKVVGGTVERLT